MPKPQSQPDLRRHFSRRNSFEAVAIALAGLLGFGWDLPSEPHFADESAYLSQSFYGDLFIRGDRDSPAWLEYAGYDLPPLPKYLINLGLRAEGYRRPPRAAAVAWYANINRQFVPRPVLTAARRPSVILGAVGCVAMYALGTIGFDRRVGWISALLLILNPLYRMHARRAMSDVPAEALILASLAVGLWSWREVLAKGAGRRWPGVVALAIGSGALAGLATSAKLNGTLAGFILGGWSILALPLAFPNRWAKALVVMATLAAGIVSFATFAALNPFLTAHPPAPIPPALEPLARMSFAGRVRAVAEHRASVSAQVDRQFPLHALSGPLAKVEAVAVQGYGRFGPFGPRGWTNSEIRFDWRQDWGAVVWLPLVLLGFVVAWARGLRQARRSEPPTAWAIAIQAAVALAVVTAFIPLAWDRYFLSIQPGSTLLGSAALVGAFDRARVALGPKRAGGAGP